MNSLPLEQCNPWPNPACTLQRRPAERLRGPSEDSRARFRYEYLIVEIPLLDPAIVTGFPLKSREH